jgi:hypothetical protein
VAPGHFVLHYFFKRRGPDGRCLGNSSAGK